VSRVIASARAPGAAYAAFDAHRDGDFRPFVFRTEDFGATWMPLHADLPAMGSVNSVLEHPDNADVLFLGTEHALFASTDAGATWAKVPNLPTTAYDDLLIHPREKDLVVATHGRAIWILDDTRPLVEWSRTQGATALFSIAPGTLKVYRKDTSYRGQAEFAGENPVDGVLVTYRLGPGSGDATLRIARDDGEVIRRIQVPSAPGVHRVNWDLRHPTAEGPDMWAPFHDPELARPIADRGPLVSPGRYTVTLVARGGEYAQAVDVRGDPEMPISVAEYRSRERFMLDLMGLSAEVGALMQAMGVSGGGFGFGQQAGPRDTPEARIRRVSRAVNGIFGELNGGQVRPGTLYPPTRSQRDAVEAARAELAAIRRETGR